MHRLMPLIETGEQKLKLEYYTGRSYFTPWIRSWKMLRKLNTKFPF